jgi:hypothetical protein
MTATFCIVLLPSYHRTTDIISVKLSLPSATDGIQQAKDIRVQVLGMTKKADYKQS